MYVGAGCPIPDRQGVDIDALPHAKAWHENIAARPAVQGAVALFANDRKEFSQMSEEEKAQQRESFFWGQAAR